jgi:hypothetical protein
MSPSAIRWRRACAADRLLEPFTEPVRVLDVGGTAKFWLFNVPEIRKRTQITLLNLEQSDVSQLVDARSLVGDARRMPEFGERSFDVCFSNSVIEHVGSFEDQTAMAAEIRRVAATYFVQTPNRYFPIEPHFHFPCWQFLPLPIRASLHRRLDLGWMPRQPDARLARSEVAQIRLLDIREFQALFPDGEIRREKIGPLTKSLMAIRSIDGA